MKIDPMTVCHFVKKDSIVFLSLKIRLQKLSHLSFIHRTGKSKRCLTFIKQKINQILYVLNKF